ncbi:MAG: DUF3795 domain-containing protein [Saprospiraceae bacterium]|nr:DUF3795 domain-containing protein [Saprospiraceae bacterium]
MPDSIKQYHTIGCCGIDCGLCPRYHAKGDSACPGCGGPDFKLKHPSCGFLTCCAIKHGLEVCAECEEFPCKRFDSERQGYDSFVTHQQVFPNQAAIKSEGLCCFLEKQHQRIGILKHYLEHYDDGRSKGFFCLATALLPIEHLIKTEREVGQTAHTADVQSRCKALRTQLEAEADNLGIELKLRTKA